MGGLGTACSIFFRACTAKVQYRKIEKSMPRKGIARGLSPHFHIHEPVRDLYNPTIGLPILLQENIWTILGMWK